MVAVSHKSRSLFQMAEGCLEGVYGFSIYYSEAFKLLSLAY